MRRVLALTLVGLASAVTACSGGSRATSGPIPPPAASSAAPSGQTARASLTLVIPQKLARANARPGHTRGRSYISPSSLGAVVVATSNSGTTADNASYGYNLSSTGPCAMTDGGETCTLSFPLYADTYTISIGVFDHNEDGVSPGAGSPSAPIGNLLSGDRETETVVLGGDNQFNNFLLHAEVDAFTLLTAATYGATGGSPGPSPHPNVEFAALDADSNEVDSYPNATTYANAPFTPTVSETGDTTGCSSPCVSASNGSGTTTAGTATVSEFSDETFTLSYTGGGGPGSGVTSSVGGAAPTGQQPYEGQVKLSGSNGSATASIVPLFAYPTTVTITNGAVAYLWAAQAAIPNGANTSTGSYTAYFSTPGTTSCMNASMQTIASVGTGTYYPGYGEVYPITPGANGTCTLTLSDGATPDADTVSVPVTVGAPSGTISVPCPQSTYQPTGMVRRRSAAAADTGPAPTLVQYALGVSQATLPGPVTAGDTLVVIIGDNPGGPNLPSQYTEFDAATDDFGFVFTRDVTASGSIGALSAGDTACNTAMWIGEFSGTSSSSIQGANAGAGATPNATTPSIVPNAANGLVISSFVALNTAAAMASSGYTEYFAYGPDTSLDVQLAKTPTTDTTDPLTNTFSGVQNPEGHAEIFQIPPSSFVGTPPSSNNARYRHKAKRARL